MNNDSSSASYDRHVDRVYRLDLNVIKLKFSSSSSLQFVSKSIDQTKTTTKEIRSSFIIGQVQWS